MKQEPKFRYCPIHDGWHPCGGYIPDGFNRTDTYQSEYLDLYFRRDGWIEVGDVVNFKETDETTNPS